MIFFLLFTLLEETNGLGAKNSRLGTEKPFSKQLLTYCQQNYTISPEYSNLLNVTQLYFKIVRVKLSFLSQLRVKVVNL